MGFGFRKSIKIAPGVRVNVGKRGIGASVGVKGLRYSVHSSGQRRTTASIPGTGISYTTSGRNYKSSSYQRQEQLVRQQKEQEKLKELERNRLKVELYENRREMLKSIHKECDDPVNWNEIKQSSAPFQKGHKGPRESEAYNQLTNYKPSFFNRLFKQEQQIRHELEANVNEARQKDLEDYSEWESLVEVATKVIEGDLDTYLQVIEEFSPLDDLIEFGSGFEFIIEEPTSLIVDFDVHTNDVIPAEVVSLTKTGKVSIKKMPITKYYDLQQDYVCSCILRIARDMFSLLPIEKVIINALDEQFNSATGHNVKNVILSIKIDKYTLNSLNFENIDCSDSMGNFEHHMNFKKTKGFSPVKRMT